MFSNTVASNGFGGNGGGVLAPALPAVLCANALNDAIVNRLRININFFMKIKLQKQSQYS